jgi:hypothetical protein
MMDHLVAWQRILLDLIGQISYRLLSREPTPIFYRELADALDHLAARVRREAK